MTIEMVSPCIEVSIAWNSPVEENVCADLGWKNLSIFLVAAINTVAFFS